MNRRIAAIALAVILSVALPAIADTHITKKTYNDAAAMMGGQAEGTAETWIGDEKIVEITGDRTTIVDFEAKKLYLVNHGDKTYNELDLPIDLAKIAPEMAAMMEQMTGQMKFDISVVPTEETKEINGYKAKLSKIVMKNSMGMDMETNIWTTSEIDINPKIWHRMAEEMARMSMPGIADIMKKVGEIDGFPVLTETVVNMMGQKMTSREEVVSVEQGSPPKGLYSPPADYALESFDAGGMMGGGR